MLEIVTKVYEHVSAKLQKDKGVHVLCVYIVRSYTMPNINKIIIVSETKMSSSEIEYL